MESYHILGRIGEGAHGIVLKAKHIKVGSIFIQPLYCMLVHGMFQSRPTRGGRGGGLKCTTGYRSYVPDQQPLTVNYVLCRVLIKLYCCRVVSLLL